MIFSQKTGLFTNDIIYMNLLQMISNNSSHIKLYLHTLDIKMLFTSIT